MKASARAGKPNLTFLYTVFSVYNVELCIRQLFLPYSMMISLALHITSILIPTLNYIYLPSVPVT